MIGSIRWFQGAADLMHGEKGRKTARDKLNAAAPDKPVRRPVRA
jgi:hypothetical protein